MSFWSSIFSPKRERFSLEELQRLHSVLLRNQVVSDANREVVVETLRSISELVIYGDQHDPGMVEYFLTENILGHFHQILLQRTARRGSVAIQVLQTLSILIQNVRTQQTVYYLFSNDHINNIAALRFDFEDDEVLGYYVNLLKTISLRLNEDTVQFFFRDGGAAPGDATTPTAAAAAAAPASPRSPHASAFPLYTEAVKFVAHRDGMVRAAVKTLALNVFAIPLPSLRTFLAAPPAASVFDRLATYTAERCTALDQLLSSWDATAPRMAAMAETCLAEIEDVLSFCSDVMAVGVPALSALLLSRLWAAVVGPALFWPLMGEHEGAAAAMEGLRIEGGGGAVMVKTVKVGPLCSLYALERAMCAITDPLLSSLVVSALLGGPAAEAAAALAATMPGPDGAPLLPADELLAELKHAPDAYRARVLGMLRGDDPQTAAAAVRLVASILARRCLPEETAEAVGLLPRRRRVQRRLIQALTADSEGADRPEPPQAPAPPPPTAPLPTAQEDTSQTSLQLDNDAILTATPAAEAEGSSELPSPSSSAAARLRRYSPTGQSLPAPLPDSDPAAVLTKAGETNFDEVIDALMAALGAEGLPPLVLPVAGWALHRLLSSDSGPAELTAAWTAALDAAVARRGAALAALLQGPWADALAPAAALAWPRSRESVLRAGAGPVHTAAHNWVQAVLLHELHWQLGGGDGGSGAAAAAQVASSNFSVAGKLATVSVAAAVAVAQTREVLKTGGIAKTMGESDDAIAAAVASPATPGSPLTPAAGVIPPGTPSAAGSGAAAAPDEVKEGAAVALPTEGTSAFPCRVSFARGADCHVVVCVLQPTTPPGGSKPPAASRAVAIVEPTAAAGTGMGGTTSPHYGTVLSVAPLLAAAPEQDAAHPQWLHIKVRTPLAGMLHTLRAGPPGAELAAMDRGLAEGHWVLAFADAETAGAATAAINAAAATARAEEEARLQPLLI